MPCLPSPLRLRGRRLTAAVLVLTTACATAALVIPSWRLSAQTRRPDAPAEVRLLSAQDARPAIAPGDRGATYYWLEEQAARVTTRFTDATATAERAAGSDLKTRLTDLAGNELAVLTLDRVGAANSVVDIRVAGRPLLRAEVKPGLRPTLAWANRQAYSAWKDPIESAEALEWDDTLIRTRGAKRRNLHDSTVELLTEWPDEFSARAAPGMQRSRATGPTPERKVLATQLKSHAVDVGSSTWYVNEQVFEWNLPGLTEGWVDSERLEPVGGWTFTPDLAWLNVQSYAFQRFHTQIQTDGFVAERRKGLLDYLADIVSPTVFANDVGCDGLHWLDGSVFRPCCDTHDACYAKNGCSWRSWWQVWKSWSCDYCNGAVFFCFATLTRPYWDHLY